MKTVEIKLYEFSELDKKAQQRALDDLRDINVYDEWWGHTYDMWKTKLIEMGFISPEISFTGFWNQGDGASFTSEGIDIDLLIKSQGIEVRDCVKRLLGKGLVEVDYYSHKRTNAHYVHENSCTIDIGFTCYPKNSNGDNISNHMDNLILPVLEDLNRKLGLEIYRDLENEYESLISDELVAEAIEANEYLFTEDGKQY